MILSKQKCCLLLAGVSTESQKRTSVPQTKRVILATRSMTRINVGLALSYVKLLLFSWKTYMCNLKAWFINKKWGFLWAQTVLHSYRICFHFVMRGILCLTFTNRNSATLYTCLTTPLDILTIYSPSISLNLRKIFLIYIQWNFSWTKQIRQTKKLLSLI